MEPRVTIIIPTLGTRREALLRAIGSLRFQTVEGVLPLVVVNGDRFDPDFVQELRAMPDIAFHQIEEGGVSPARYYGLRQVATPYFGFLDDDDEYLPQGVEQKLAVLADRPDVDLVVGNGVRKWDGKGTPLWEDTPEIDRNPVASLLKLNWLQAAGPLFRTDRVDAAYFDFDFSYFEVTYLAYRLALSFKIAFMDERTYIVHDTPNSASDSEAYRLAEPDMLARIAALDMPAHMRRKIQHKRLDVLHNLSDWYRSKGDRARARHFHIQSLRGLYGLSRFLLYTRHLL